jgi:hypothetical protein
MHMGIILTTVKIVVHMIIHKYKVSSLSLKKECIYRKDYNHIHEVETDLLHI